MANIPHYLRLKPRGDKPEDKTKECLIETQTETQVRFKDTTHPNKFTRVFNEISQLDLYKETLGDITEELFDDKDGALFTLGPSNSGKSYSIYGDDSNPGISIYSLNAIFNKIGSNFADYKILKRHFGESFLVSSKAAGNGTTGEYALSVSVFEIYNDRIRDLSLDISKTLNQSLDIVTDAKDGKIKPNRVRQIYVSNLDEAKFVLHKSIKRRAVSSTNLNTKSSRSHLFVYLNLHRVIGKNFVKTSRLTIADLAGSERTKSAKTEGKEFREGNYTNQSLTELGRCLALMKSKRFDKSILRTSKLTRLLLTDLFGNLNQNRIKILLTLDPYSSLSNILHSLRYIQPVSKVTINSERNSLDTDSAQVSQLAEELKSFREANEVLEKERETAQQKLIDSELALRQELSDEYEQKIQELEIVHQRAIDELKEANQKSVDEKLEMLSNDYEEKITKLLEEQKKKIDELTQDYENQLDDLSRLYNQANDNSDRVEELEKELSALRKDKLRSEQALIKDVTKEQKEKDELMIKLQNLEKEFKQLEKKEKKKAKRIEDLTEELTKSKRKSDVAFESDEEELEEKAPKTLKKVRISEPKKDYKVTEEEEEEEKEEENKENELSASVFSPIKIEKRLTSGSSPNKHFKFIETPIFPASVSPKKGGKKSSIESSPSKKVLKEVNLDYTLPSPKIKSRSPSKSPNRKKKLQHRIVDDSF